MRHWVLLAQKRNCGNRETDVASEQLWNNIRFWATAGEQTTEQCPLLGSRFLISKNRRPLLGNGSVNTSPRQRIRIREWTVLSGGPCRGVMRKRTGATKSVSSHPKELKQETGKLICIGLCTLLCEMRRCVLRRAVHTHMQLWAIGALSVLRRA
jgi:hypothetical protein